MIIFFVLFAVATALILQKVLLEKSLDSVEGDHRPDNRIVDPDVEFHIVISLTNQSRRFVPFLRVQEHLHPEMQPQISQNVTSNLLFQEHCVEFTTWLRPRQRTTVQIPVSISSRGRYPLRQLSLHGGDFLGLTEHEITCGRFSEVVVAPRPLPSMQLDEQFGSFMGDVSARRFILEDPVLTLGYREYTGREPMKMISWTQSARGSGLMVKQYDYTLEPSVSVLLNVDTASPDQEALLETCFSIARTVCEQLEERGVKYDFVSNCALAGELSDSGAIGEGLGTRHYRSILELLGRATYTPRFSAQSLLEKEARRSTSTAGRIFITPDQCPETARGLDRLREVSGGSLLVLNAEEVAQW